MWWSEPASIRGWAGIGYGPLLDSEEYRKRTLTLGVAEVTTLNGIP